MTSVVVRSGLGILSVVAMIAATAGLAADERHAGQAAAPQEAQAQRAAPKAILPLKVTVVVARYQGEKRTASLPFTLMVNTNERSTSLRMENSVPIPSQATGPVAAAVASYSYRPIGTSLDCGAETTAEDGRFRLQLTISDSQIFSEAGGGSPSIVRGVPTFQSFTSQSALLMRDGQTLQYTTATDKVNGEVVKVDVTLNVIK